jgi:DNA repair exonuclease SbcCD ATPase subunit
MIEFERIRVKNFMSYGNVVTEVPLKQGKVLVHGKNGHGKSSIWLDGITYALYGKPFRKINIPQLINSINQKDCWVEVDFFANQKNYTVKRGMKPGKFEIWENGVLLKQEAAAKDYQGYLEKQILKINHKTFTQVLILGSAAFTPFMQQSGPVRREIIEDILDIGVFSKMQRLLRDRVTATREALSTVDLKIEFAKKESASQKKLIDTLEAKKEEYLHTLQDQKDGLRKRLIEEKAVLDTLEDSYDQAVASLEEFDTNAFEDMYQSLAQEKRDLRAIQDKVDKIVLLDTCPTCHQQVSDDHKHGVQTKLTTDIAISTPKIESLEEEIAKLKAIKDSRDLQTEVIAGYLADIRVQKGEVNSLEIQITNTDTQIAQHAESSTVDVKAEKDKLKDLAQNALKLLETKAELLQEKAVQEVSVILLKDTGIKASIVKEYLPILNKLINKYLMEFDFFVNFELDETFTETIKSRGRDAFSYASFSEGEKKRIDLAILLSFRYIASMKNSAKVNLIVADEIDGGLDDFSKEKFVELITGLDCHAWVISHVIAGTELANHFEKSAEITKVGDFSSVNIR